MALLAAMRQLRPMLCQHGLLQPALQQHLAPASAQQLTSLQPAAWRGIATSPAVRGLEEFFDTPGKDGQPPPAGTAYSHRPSADALPWPIDMLAACAALRCLPCFLLCRGPVGLAVRERTPCGMQGGRGRRRTCEARAGTICTSCGGLPLLGCPWTEPHTADHAMPDRRLSSCRPKF